MKKILMLGGTRYLLPVIKAAHAKDFRVITCDYIPENIAHKYSDEYYNVSITDRLSILELAKKLKIDGIMSFGTDPGVETAAFVAEQMGLPSCGSYEAVHTLQSKSVFRKFLNDYGFNTPLFKSYTDIKKCVDEIEFFNMPVIVKPTDSAGSKGVSKVSSADEIYSAVENALKYSRNGEIIIEEYIDAEKFASDSECFSVDGKLTFYSFSNQYFDKKASNPFTPSAYSWPSLIGYENEKYLVDELKRFIHLLGSRTSIYNVETRVSSEGKPYIMEFSPRGGGNRLAEIISKATGVDLIGNAVLAAVGEKVNFPMEYSYDGCWAECILHSYKSGKYAGINIDKSILPNVQEIDEWLQIGDNIDTFSGANAAAGTVVLRFENNEKAMAVMPNIFDLIKVTVV